MDMQKFAALGLSQSSLDALEQKGFEEPTAIQAQCIPLILREQVDVVGQAQTGTGKTAAFGLPALDIVDPSKLKVQVLVLTPTRELAIQVAEELSSLRGTRPIKIVPIYGGQSYTLQLGWLKAGAQIVVGTPGRVIDLMERKKLMLDTIDFFILDEADEMLNMGFIEDIEKILEQTPAQKRMLLFSATMPRRILDLAKKYMHEYRLVQAGSAQMTVELTDQIYFEVAENDKLEALCRIIDTEQEFYGLIFCRTKVDVDIVAKRLQARGYAAEAIHGDIVQAQRQKVFGRFKKKEIAILVATDVAARGLDVSNLTHVVNYALPQDPESYVHRIGRTGRAGKRGTAITLITPYEFGKLSFIRNRTRVDIRKQKVPAVEEVIKIKRDRIKQKVHALLDHSDLESFNELSASLLKKNEPQKVVSALLKQAFRDDLEISSYKEIREFGVGRPGQTKLFVAMGRNNGITKAKLVQFMTDKARINPALIQDVTLFGDFSLVSVPFAEAEIILRAFDNQRRGEKPLIRRDRKPPFPGAGGRPVRPNAGFRPGGPGAAYHRKRPIDTKASR